MDEQGVRERAEALCAGIVAGDVERVTADFSVQLRQNLGEVLALLPLRRMKRRSSRWIAAALRTPLTEEVRIQTRWKERDGRTTMIEASHLSRAETAPPSGDADVADEESTE